MEKWVGVDAFNEKYKMFIKQAMDNNGEPLTLERRAEIYEVAYPAFADQMMTEYKLDYYQDNSQELEYAETAYYYYTTYASDDTEGIEKDMPLFKKYLKSAEQKKYVRNWIENKAMKSNSADGWLTIAKYKLADGDFLKAKEIGKKAKKMAKAEKVDQSSYKLFLKEVKKAQKSAR